MTEKDLTAIAQGFAQVLREYATAVGSRLAVVEAKERGLNGKDGVVGPRGPEGQPGRDGRDGLPGVQGERGLDGLSGKDGLNGKDGRDGTLDGVFVEFDEERSWRWCFSNGDPVPVRVKGVMHATGWMKSPSQIYRGVWVAQPYERGDSVTYGGSQWNAMRDTKSDEKPGDGSTAWKLAVKMGRDGKSGPQGKPGEKGGKGDKGDPGKY